MQQDFHFEVIYCLCRCAGLGPPESRTVAAASQFTDACAFPDPVLRPGGTAYRPILTDPSGLAVLALRRGYTGSDWWRFQQGARWCGRQLKIIRIHIN